MSTGWQLVVGILVFAGLLTVIIIGLLVEHLFSRWLERRGGALFKSRERCYFLRQEDS